MLENPFISGIARQIEIAAARYLRFLSTTLGLRDAVRPGWTNSDQLTSSRFLPSMLSHTKSFRKNYITKFLCSQIKCKLQAVSFDIR